MAYTINLERAAVKEKIAQVDATLKDTQNYPTVALLELHKLPDSLFQPLRKKIIEEGGKVKVLKKPVLQRVLAKIPKLSSYSEKAERPFALILTKSSPYALHQFFNQNKKKRAAKTGEKAPFEIIVPAGDTDIPPGPALSELKAAGISVQIKAGKIVIGKDSVVAKPGDIITDMKAKGLQKLGILPFEVKARLYIASDGSYVYSAELLDIGETLTQDLSESLSQAFNFSLNANYLTPQTAPLLLGQAIRQAIDLSLNASVYNTTTISTLLSSAVVQGQALGDLKPKEPAKAEEKKPEEKAEQKKEEPKEEAKKEEKKDDKKEGDKS